MASPSSNNPPADASSHGDSLLPSDVVYDILLRLPAKDLCRFRAVCPSWRALTSDPLFVKAHTARHLGPLLAAAGSRIVAIVDPSSGDVIKRVRTGDMDSRVQRTHLDLVCLVGECHPLAAPLTLLNPATGATLGSSHNISDKYECLLKKRTVSMDSCSFGKVPSTGEYKALRFLKVRPLVSRTQLCEVMTLDGTGHARWRARPGPPAPVFAESNAKSVVVDGVAYFLFDFSHPHCEHLKVTVKPASIAAFNLETEEWMPALDGPEAVSSLFCEEDDLRVFADPTFVEFLSITNLSGSLVTVHNPLGQHMELWFLMDVQKGLWVKKYHINYHRRENLFSYPLLVLDDDRLIFIVQKMNALEIYDPKTDTYTDLFKLEDYKSIGVYTGSLLC